MRLDVSQRPPPIACISAIVVVDQRGDRQLGAVALRLAATNGEVFAHPVDGEAEVELARVHRLPAIVHLPGLRRPLGDRLHDEVEVEPGGLGKGDGFRQALKQTGNGDLVDHLGELPGARWANAVDGPGVAGDQRFGALERLLVAADHDGQRARLRARLPARYGRVEEGYAAGATRRVERARHFRRGGRMVDERGAGAHTLEGAMLARCDGAQIVVVADAAKDEVGAQCRRRRRVGRAPAAVLGHPRGRFGGVAVIDGDLMPALPEEVPGHGESHDAEADPRHPRHSSAPYPREPSD